MTPLVERMMARLEATAAERKRLTEAHLTCRCCGRTLTVGLPWQGRPRGPQCSCNPNSWGNWKRS